MADRAATTSSAGLPRRSFLKASGGAALLAAGAGSAGKALPAQRKSAPNILLIITDQQHIGAISAAGCRHLGARLGSDNITGSFIFALIRAYMIR